MRASWLGAGLAVLLLVLTSRSLATQQRAPLSKETKDAKLVTVVDGYGPTKSQAEIIALGRGRDYIMEWLAEQSVGYRLPPELLEIEYLKNEGMLRLLEAKEVAKGRWYGQVRVDVQEAFVRKVQTQARDDYLLDRHLLVARILGWIVIALLTLAGYLQLDEMSRGYYTRRLRVAACVLLIVAALVLIQW